MSALMDATMIPEGRMLRLRGGQGRSVKILAVGILAGGVGAGLFFNRATVEQPVAANTSVTAPAVALEAPVQPRVSAAAPAAALPVRHVAVAAPPDPFQPTRAEAPAATYTASTPRSSGGGGWRSNSVPSLPMASGGGYTVQALPAPVPVVPPPGFGTTASRPSGGDESLGLTGVVGGDTPLAVVQHGGQTHYVKIGDKVADKWKLDQIKDRSAVFSTGSQRVEVPIKGGSSE